MSKRPAFTAGLFALGARMRTWFDKIVGNNFERLSVVRTARRAEDRKSAVILVSQPITKNLLSASF